MRHYSLVTMFVLPILFLSLTECTKNKSTTETEKYGEVSGTVTFVGTWPSFGNVQVSIWTSLPATGPPAAATENLTPDVATQTYKIEGLSKGTYPALLVSWRDPANPAGAEILGIYWAQSDSLGVNENGQVIVEPISIEISDENLVYSDTNIKANLDIAP